MFKAWRESQGQPEDAIPRKGRKSMKIVNTKAYKPTAISTVIELKVKVLLDEVPGAWHDPEDIMNWMANNPYIQSVELVDTKKGKME